MGGACAWGPPCPPQQPWEVGRVAGADGECLPRSPSLPPSLLTQGLPNPRNPHFQNRRTRRGGGWAEPFLLPVAGKQLFRGL